MFVLVACEESQRVCIEFRRKGHIAFSCDLIDCSGGHPEWHIKTDVMPLINGYCGFITQDRNYHYIPAEWDLIIAHPPCTDLSLSGARHFERKRSDGSQRSSIEFFGKFLKCNAKSFAIENPANIIGGEYIKRWFPEFSWMPKHDQVIQPYEYGDPERKTTWLWLKNLKPLKPTNIVEPNLKYYLCSDGRTVSFSEFFVTGKSSERAKNRSKTFKGIAKAMAEQWG